MTKFIRGCIIKAMDWSKTENIIFVSVVGAAILFFLATAIAVIAKGKRACKAGDVLLRIASSLAFACSVAMLACVVLSQLTGGYRIDVTAAPTLYFGSRTVVLPMPRLFEALATSVGSSLVTGITVVSLIALVCDCLLANKKAHKANVAQPQPAENEKPERLSTDESVGDETAENAQTASEVRSEPDTVERQDPVEQATETTDDVLSDAAAVDNDSVAVNDADYGEIVDEDREVPEPALGDEEKPWYNEDGEFDLDGNAEGNVESNADEFESDEPTAETDDRPIESETKPNVSETETQSVDTLYDDTEYTYDEASVEQEPEPVSEQDRQDDLETFYEPEPKSEREPETETHEYGAADVRDEVETEQEDDIARGDRELEEFLKESWEPDRDIYIPEIRTVARGKSDTQRAQSGKSKAQRSKSGSAKSKTDAAKPSAKKPNKRGGAKSAAKESAATDNKSLPMGRRYVIIDRRSAVNIFSDYLKERDKQDKDKLESSINKIILK